MCGQQAAMNLNKQIKKKMCKSCEQLELGNERSHKRKFHKFLTRIEDINQYAKRGLNKHIKGSSKHIISQKN